MKFIIENSLPLTNALGFEFDLRNDIDNWDYLTVISSKSDMKNIEKKLNINFHRIKNNPVWRTDSLNLVLFFRNQEIFKIIELNRKVGDFEMYEELIPRTKAILRTTQAGKLTFKN